MKIQKILIGGFIFIAIIFAIFILKLAYDGKKDWVENTAIQSKIVDIYQGDKGKPNYQIMKLESNQSFAIPKNMLSKLQIGDSVFKNKKDDFYTFKLLKNKELIKSNWQ
jgi:hypothetical protein